ncbi:SNF2-related protein [Nostoc sp.]|uniref:SNF2-related protein n=1 Tax=Nostoc sp. TaxID=1180 RepID=UPI002FFC7039
MHTLRWNCVTSTDAKLFQVPYRAGIEVKAYQLEPLLKALLMPRVGLFIADDVGLGKTIEAGLILREMLMRQKVRRVVISCPPSVIRQWQEEMESRFGLTFMILDRKFIAARRQERGYGINPWMTHTRFIISHALLRDETYAAPLRDWLDDFAAASMLILCRRIWLKPRNLAEVLHSIIQHPFVADHFYNRFQEFLGLVSQASPF